MWLEQIQRIAKLAQTRYRQDQLLVVAIDGCGGAGKTTLSQALAKEIQTWAPVQVLKVDDFFRPVSSSQREQLKGLEAHQAYFNVTDFNNSVLTPLVNGQNVSYKPFHWIDGEGKDEIELLSKGVVIIDGVFSFSKLLRPHIDLSIFVDTPVTLRKQRMLSRPQPDTGWIGHWQSTEAWHHQHEHTADGVDFVLSGSKQ